MMTVWISLHVDGRGLASVYEEDVEDETKRRRGMGLPGANEDRNQAPGRAEQNRNTHIIC